MKYNKCAVLEGLLFVVGDDGLSIEQIMDILSVDKDEAKEIIKSLMQEYEKENRGIRINFLGNTIKLPTIAHKNGIKFLNRHLLLHRLIASCS